MITIKKIGALIGSLVMIGATAGMAAAANFPAPFVVGGGADVALVYGADAAISDYAASAQINSKLATELASQTADGTTPGSTASGGDSLKIERSSDKLNLGDNFTAVWVTSITDDNMPNLLADGTYMDDDNTEYGFTQKIELGNDLELSHFSDSDYKENVPVIGVKAESDNLVLNYTMDFTTNPDFNASIMETTDLTLLGRTYYVLDVANTTTNKLTLLDSASSVVITEGETKTVGGKEVSISYISSTNVKIDVDGAVTNSLAAGATYKLSDASYIGVKEILYNAKDTGISKVEISIGKGKLELTDATTIELNDVAVSEIKAFLHTSSENLDKIVLEWKTDDDEFLAPDSDLVMPGFGAVKLTMGEMNFPKAEVINVDWTSDTIKLTAPIKDGTATLYLLHVNSTGEFDLIGKDSDERLKTTNGSVLLFNAISGTSRDKYFVATWNSSSEGESYLLSASSIAEDTANGRNTVTIKNEVTNVEVCKTLTNGETCTIGNVILTIGAVQKNSTDKNVNMTINAGGDFNRLITKEGLTIYLPWVSGNATGDFDDGEINSSGVTGAARDPGHRGSWNESFDTKTTTAGHSPASFLLFMDEENKDGTLGAGTKFNITLDESGTSNKPHVSGVDSGKSEYEIDDSDDYETYVESELGTKILYKSGGDQDSAIVTYHGDQSYSDVYVSAPDVTVSGGGVGGGATELGTPIYKDSESASFASKNLIVIGGSCINSIAAELLGSAACEADFTTLTTVGAGEALVKSFSRNSKVALLVAGYNAADTTKAATYLVNNAVDTTVGTALKVTSATEATAIAAAA